MQLMRKIFKLFMTQKKTADHFTDCFNVTALY